ncbi:hypothetical protein C4G69_RS01315 [Vibrio parahaemolyticus]|nr:hypothetical protein [Vibrio parahaemolyticus]EJG1033946.1 hypothetical protein [Vibrio parahaemolyticus]
MNKEQKLLMLDVELERMRENYINDIQKAKSFNFPTRDIHSVIESNIESLVNLKRNELDLKEDEIQSQRAKSKEIISELRNI